jgi:hypothetical protein
LVAQIESDVAARRDAGFGCQRPVGAKKILAAQPHDLPAQSDSSPAPFVHASSTFGRHAFKAAYRAFVDAFRAAATSFRGGDRTVEFPQAAFPPPLPFVAAAPCSSG